MNNISLFNMISKNIFLSFTKLDTALYTGKHQFCFDGAVSGQRSSQCTIAHCTVLLNSDVICIQWCTYFISCDPELSNQ